MTSMSEKTDMTRKEPLDPKTRKRNIILGIILALIIIFVVLFTAQGIYKSDFNRDENQQYDQTQEPQNQ
jgi:hypothetical protein